jgi:hypothetical protein
VLFCALGMFGSALVVTGTAYISVVNSSFELRAAHPGFCSLFWPSRVAQLYLNLGRWVVCMGRMVA